MWKEKVTELQTLIAALDKAIVPINEKLEPIEAEIQALKNKASPFWKQRNQLGRKKETLEAQLHQAKAELYLEELEVGDQLWILHDSYYRGRYETITTERMVKQERQREPKSRYVPHRSKPHLVTITEKRSTNEFLAKAEDIHMMFLGKAQRRSRSEGAPLQLSSDGRPRILWRKYQ